MKHLVFVGACYLDTILSVPQYPDEDSKLRATSLSVRRGGNCSNTLEVLEQLLKGESVQDVQLHLVSCLPSPASAGTRKILNSFGSDSRISFRHCLYREGCTEPASSYIIRSETSGSRTIVNYNDLPEMTEDEFVRIADAFRGESESEMWWHFEGRIPETTLRCIQYLRRTHAPCRVSVEVEKPNREGLRELASEADVVFYSKSWAESRGYREAEECLRCEAPSRVSLICCTWGALGAAALSLPTAQFIFAPAPAVPPGSKVIDSIGAGDTFIAGLLFGMTCHPHDWQLQRKLSFAVDLATRKVQLDGFQGLATKMDQRGVTQTSCLDRT